MRVRRGSAADMSATAALGCDTGSAEDAEGRQGPSRRVSAPAPQRGRGLAARRSERTTREFSRGCNSHPRHDIYKRRLLHLKDLEVDEVHLDHERHECIGDLRLRVQDRPGLLWCCFLVSHIVQLRADTRKMSDSNLELY